MDNYDPYRRKWLSATNKTFPQKYEETSNSHTVSAENGFWKWRVAAVDSNGKVGRYSEWRDIKWDDRKTEPKKAKR